MRQQYNIGQADQRGGDSRLILIDILYDNFAIIDWKQLGLEPKDLMQDAELIDAVAPLYRDDSSVDSGFEKLRELQEKCKDGGHAS